MFLSIFVTVIAVYNVGSEAKPIALIHPMKKTQKKYFKHREISA